MMNNLFSMFDPSSNMQMNLNWLCLSWPLLITNKNYWLNLNRNTLIMKMIYNNFIKNILPNLNTYLFNNSIFFSLLFMYLYTSNMMSIMPFMFTPMSHLSVSMSISLPFWFSFFFKTIKKNNKEFFIHLTPSGTPMLLCPFMVIIETISNLIRPMTLAIRLSANMIAGHILLSLLSKMVSLNIFKLIPTYACLTALSILELAVCMIQAFVFTTLLSLYMSENN